MNAFDKAVATMVSRDARYPADAYHFVREALALTQQLQRREGHVSAAELLEGIRQHALKLYGPMTHLLLSEWGIHSCADFGNLVFNLIAVGQLRGQPEDRIEDFSPGFDFRKAFREPFLPPAPAPPSKRA
jgi:uncharacterized repeat protein (TIGR04138 family)